MLPMMHMTPSVAMDTPPSALTGTKNETKGEKTM